MRTIILGLFACFPKFVMSLALSCRDICVVYMCLLDRLCSVACDIPGHNYTYSFESATSHKAEYATGSEVHQYLTNFATKYNLGKYFRFRTKLVSASWDNEAGYWKLVLKDLANKNEVKETADILINASGPLNQWKWPEISGLHDYQGHLVHSANWDKKFTVDGKKVAVIGNGCDCLLKFCYFTSTDSSQIKWTTTVDCNSTESRQVGSFDPTG